MEDIINEIKEKSFSKETTYHVLPVLIFEKEALYYTKNQFIKPSEAPMSVFFMTDHFEEWIETAKTPSISDTKEIKKILSACNIYMKENKPSLQKAVQSISSNSDLLLCLNSLNKVNEELYKFYSFFINESFATEDKDLVRELPKMRLKISDFATIIWDGLEKILQTISSKYGVERDQLDRMTTNELSEIINGEEYKKVKNREIAIITSGDDTHFLFGKQVASLEKILNENNMHKEIRGRVASKGYAKGCVLKVGVNDYKKLPDKIGNRKDYILVTPMTRPEITPYIKNAKGIITDEGGATCHAAIISREFKIPCIVGAKIATKVLHDNDFVEIDANANKITKLK